MAKISLVFFGLLFLYPLSLANLLHMPIEPADAIEFEDRTTTSDPFSLHFISGEETVIAAGTWGLNWLPDGNISYLWIDGQLNVWLSGGPRTYLLRGPDFDHLSPHKLDDNGNAVPVFAPSGMGFDRDYAGSTAVMQASNGTDLLMIYHGEDNSCGDGNTKAGIGLARSSDGGQTWTREGQIITSPQMPADCSFEGFKGAGNPTVLLSADGDYFYMYYMEWVSTRPDEISLARAPRSSDGAPGTWVKFHNGDFSQPGLGGLSDAVIHRPSETAGYAGVPNVTYNMSLGRYLAVVVGHDGFYHASSIDGTDWTTPSRFFSAPTLTAWPLLNDGDSWYYYPTLITPQKVLDDFSTTSGYLYYAHGVKNRSPHYMVRRAFQLQYNPIFIPLVKEN